MIHMEFNYQALGFWMSVAQWAVQVVVIAWVYLRTKDDDNQTAISELKKDFEGFVETAATANETQNIRLTSLEKHIEHIPTKEALAKLEGEVTSVRTEVAGLTKFLERIEHQTSLIQEHLLKH